MKEKKPSERGGAKRWYAVPDPAPNSTGPIQVQLPVDAGPAPDAIEEAAHFVKSLHENKQIAREPGPLPPGATHQLVTDAEGNKRLERRRFSAI